jgi:hypothetical protein
MMRKVIVIEFDDISLGNKAIGHLLHFFREMMSGPETDNVTVYTMPLWQLCATNVADMDVELYMPTLEGTELPNED